jgi:hypothetical protein
MTIVPCSVIWTRHVGSTFGAKDSRLQTIKEFQLLPLPQLAQHYHNDKGASLGSQCFEALLLRCLQFGKQNGQMEAIWHAE